MDWLRWFRRKANLVALATCVVLLLALSACGDDRNSDDPYSGTWTGNVSGDPLPTLVITKDEANSWTAKWEGGPPIKLVEDDGKLTGAESDITFVAQGDKLRYRLYNEEWIWLDRK
jgi:uncharacterized lipoprotein YehR (DUF1307 family)